MTTVEVDFSNVQSQEPVRPGKYDVTIIQIEMKQSENSEFPYLNWTLEIVGGEFESRKLFMVTSLSPKALWKLQETFTSYGLEGEKVQLDIADDGTSLLIDPELSGQPGVATVYNEKYQGRNTSKVSDLVGPGETKEEPVPATRQSANSVEKVNPFQKKRQFK